MNKETIIKIKLSFYIVFGLALITISNILAIFYFLGLLVISILENNYIKEDTQGKIKLHLLFLIISILNYFILFGAAGLEY